MPYLLDTNALSDMIRRPNGSVATKVRAVGPREVRTSIIVAAELRFGARKNGALRLEQRLDELFAVVEVIPLSPPVDHVYGDIRALLQQAGTSIGGHDLLIASQALALGDTVVTDNVREFGRVPGLQVENWLRSPV
jgi:tRNA(fMet)-specific endonuclease VapC